MTPSGKSGDWGERGDRGERSVWTAGPSGAEDVGGDDRRKLAFREGKT